MIKGSNVLQDLDQVLSAKLASSTAGWDELRQPQVFHALLLCDDLASRSWSIGAKQLGASGSVTLLAARTP